MKLNTWIHFKINFLKFVSISNYKTLIYLIEVIIKYFLIQSFAPILSIIFINFNKSIYFL